MKVFITLSIFVVNALSHEPMKSMRDSYQRLIKSNVAAATAFFGYGIRHAFPITEIKGDENLNAYRQMSLGTNLQPTAEFISTNCKDILSAYRQSNSLLYRGEPQCRVPSIISVPPDLLSEGIYSTSLATSFFRSTEDILSQRDVYMRPSIGHLAVPDIRRAAIWGAPCSIWPLDRYCILFILYYCMLFNWFDS